MPRVGREARTLLGGCHPSGLHIDSARGYGEKPSTTTARGRTSAHGPPLVVRATQYSEGVLSRVAMAMRQCEHWQVQQSRGPLTAIVILAVPGKILRIFSSTCAMSHRLFQVPCSPSAEACGSWVYALYTLRQRSKRHKTPTSSRGSFHRGAIQNCPQSGYKTVLSRTTKPAFSQATKLSSVGLQNCPQSGYKTSLQSGYKTVLSRTTKL